MMIPVAGHGPGFPVTDQAPAAAPGPQGRAPLLSQTLSLAGSAGNRTRVNVTAIVSLALAGASLVTFGLSAFPAVIAGHVALRQIRHTGQRGREAAVAGLLLAYPAAVFVLWFSAVVILWGLGGGDR